MVVMGVAPRGRPEGCRDFQRQLPGGPSIRIALAVALLVLSSCAAAVKAPHLVTPPDPRVEDLSAFFGGFEATFVLLDLQRQELTRFNPERAARRQPPCSTFKVPNALIGLETGVLSGPEHAMKWDGTHYEIETWNQDQTLRTAIRWSVVWYFQRVAASIGEQRMRQYLHAIPYGNEDISGGLTRFWLDTSLLISADEQVDFMRRLAVGGLPFSVSSIETVRELLRLRETERGLLRGKTGTAGGSASHAALGWFVGYVQHAGNSFAFATNIEGPGANGIRAREIAEEILKHKGLL